MNCCNNADYNIPAGFPYSFAAKLTRAEASSATYEDITNPADVPSTGWALCFVDAGNKAALAIPLNWDEMDEAGNIFISLTAEQTLALAGKKLRLEVRNDSGTSDLCNAPEAVFYFVPNSLH